MRHLVWTLAIMLSACGSETPSTPSTPSSQSPQLAGSYSGVAFFTTTESSGQCPATATLTQVGDVVSVAPIVLGGTCPSLRFEIGSMLIPPSGVFPTGTEQRIRQQLRRILHDQPERIF